MIVGIGTDIVKVARLQSSLSRFGNRLAQRLLSDEEFQEFLATSRPAHFLAKRFAAKEAVAKALGLGFSQGLAFHQIRIGHDHNGRPLVHYSGRAAEHCRQQGINNSHLSIADEQDYAIAFATLVK